MNKRRNSLKRGFTLIEILIVVVILGILAAIIIPQFTDAAQDAGASSARSQLQTMRSQIELYRVQNNGASARRRWCRCRPLGRTRRRELHSFGPELAERIRSPCTSAATGDLTLTFDLTQGPSPDLNGDDAGDSRRCHDHRGW